MGEREVLPVVKEMPVETAIAEAVRQFKNVPLGKWQP